MRKSKFYVYCLLLVSVLNSAWTQNDVQGSLDHPLVTRFSNSRVSDFVEKNNEQFVVVGHTDSQRGFDYNFDLSKRSDGSVISTFSTQHGVDVDRFSPVGIGSVRSRASNTSESGREQNRWDEMVHRD